MHGPVGELPSSSFSDDIWWNLPARKLSATLVILFPSKDGPRVLLTVRSMKLKRYPGDTALPGGRAEDSEDWWTTALREAEEEIGFDTKKFKVTKLAALPAHLSAHILVVRPVLILAEPLGNTSGYVTVQELAPRLSGDEVACAYSMPLDWFLHKKNLIYERVIESEWIGNVWNFYRFRTEPSDDSWVFSSQEQKAAFERTAVVGLTAHIMVDVARYYLGKTPDFTHLDQLGNCKTIEKAVELGLFNPNDPKI